MLETGSSRHRFRTIHRAWAYQAGKLDLSSRGGGKLKRFDPLWRSHSGWLAALLAASVLVSACSVPRISNPFGSGREDTYSGPPGDQLTAITQANAGGGTLPSGMAANCPQVVAWPRDRMVTIYQQGHVGDTLYVRHRGEITKLSRECQIFAGRVVVKYGLAGRVLLGPKGSPGTVTLPVSVRAAGADQITLANDKMTVTASIPAGHPAGYFSMVREISFPIQMGARPEDYKVFVAFERNQPGAG
jgi:hypothetical protein